MHASDCTAADASGRSLSSQPWGSDYYVIKADMGDTVALAAMAGATSSSDSTVLYVLIAVCAVMAIIAFATIMAYCSLKTKMKNIDSKAAGVQNAA